MTPGRLDCRDDAAFDQHVGEIAGVKVAAQHARAADQHWPSCTQPRRSLRHVPADLVAVGGGDAPSRR